MADTTIGNANVTVGADLTQLQRGLADAERATRRFDELSRTSFTGTAQGVAHATKAYEDFSVALVRSEMAMQKLIGQQQQQTQAIQQMNATLQSTTQQQQQVITTTSAAAEKQADFNDAIKEAALALVVFSGPVRNAIKGVFDFGAGLAANVPLLGTGLSGAARIAGVALDFFGGKLNFIIAAGILAFRGMQLAWQQAFDQIDKMNKLVVQVAASGLSADMIQRVTKAIGVLNLSLDGVVNTMKNLKVATEAALGGSAFSRDLNQMIQAGNFAGNTGVAMMRQAITQEDKFRALAKLLAEAYDKGERLAALDLASRFLTPELYERLKTTPDLLDQILKQAEKVKATDIVDEKKMLYALDLQYRLNAAYKAYNAEAAGAKQSSQDFSWFGNIMIEVWIKLVEWTTKARDALRDLGNSLASLLKFEWLFNSLGGAIIAGISAIGSAAYSAATKPELRDTPSARYRGQSLTAARQFYTGGGSSDFEGNATKADRLDTALGKLSRTTKVYTDAQTELSLLMTSSEVVYDRQAAAFEHEIRMREGAKLIVTEYSKLLEEQVNLRELDIQAAKEGGAVSASGLAPLKFQKDVTLEYAKAQMALRDQMTAAQKELYGWTYSLRDAGSIGNAVADTWVRMKRALQEPGKALFDVEIMKPKTLEDIREAVRASGELDTAVTRLRVNMANPDARAAQVATMEAISDLWREGSHVADEYSKSIKNLQRENLVLQNSFNAETGTKRSPLDVQAFQKYLTMLDAARAKWGDIIPEKALQEIREVLDAWLNISKAMDATSRNQQFAGLLGAAATKQELLAAATEKVENSLGAQNIKMDANQQKRAKDIALLQVEEQWESRRVALLGNVATVEDHVAGVKRKLIEADMAGMGITEKQTKSILENARANALGVRAIEQQVISEQIRGEVVGMGVAATTAYTTAQELLRRKRLEGTPVTAKEVAEINAEAAALGKARQQTELLNAAFKAKMERKYMFLSDTDATIARELADKFEYDIPKALRSTIAEQMRWNSYIKQGIDEVTSLSTSFYTDFVQAFRQGTSAMDSLKQAGTNAVNSIIDLLAKMAIKWAVLKAAGGIFGGVEEGGGMVAGATAVTTSAGALTTASGTLVTSATGAGEILIAAGADLSSTLIAAATTAANILMAAEAPLAIAAVAHSGGVIGADSLTGRIVPPTLFSGAKRFARGGLVSSDEVPIIAHKSEEVLRRDDPRHRYNLMAAGSGGGTAPPVNVNVQFTHNGNLTKQQLREHAMLLAEHTARILNTNPTLRPRY